ncbi:MAG: response regulator [Candidatus Omnitrophica bacterium]|nr:response regulator [Candidatus Omnitrophota bacterium]
MAKKILVVDDDPVGVALMEGRLSRAGYETLLAFNGEQGLKFARVDQPDLIILDVEMPEMNGYTFLTEIRKIETLKDVPVIVLTAHEENHKIFARKGIANYLIKPVNFEVLFKQMDQLLGKS